MQVRKQQTHFQVQLKISAIHAPTPPTFASLKEVEFSAPAASLSHSALPPTQPCCHAARDSCCQSISPPILLNIATTLLTSHLGATPFLKILHQSFVLFNLSMCKIILWGYTYSLLNGVRQKKNSTVHQIC